MLRPRIAFTVFTFVLLLELIPLSFAAWRGTEYNGVTRALSDIDGLLPEDALVLVDHFIYGTPLAFIFGRDVLIVSDLHRGNNSKDVEKMEAAMRIINREAERRPVFVFTITRTGLEYFPVELPCDPVPLFDKLISIPRMIHHRNRHPFEKENIERRFRLYRLLYD